jgi:hypothetical protein
LPSGEFTVGQLAFNELNATNYFDIDPDQLVVQGCYINFDFEAISVKHHIAQRDRYLW